MSAGAHMAYHMGREKTLARLAGFACMLCHKHKIIAGIAHVQGKPFCKLNPQVCEASACEWGSLFACELRGMSRGFLSCDWGILNSY